MKDKNNMWWNTTMATLKAVASESFASDFPSEALFVSDSVLNRSNCFGTETVTIELSSYSDRYHN